MGGRPIKDLVGQRFGRLTVIKRVENSQYNQVQWLCKCSCGNTKITTQALLKRGKVKSCGCLKKQVCGYSNINNLVGKKFGRLIVVKRVDNKGRDVRWLCKCTCGKAKIVSSKHLLSKSTRSCGCLVTKVAKENQKKGAIAGCIDGTKIGSLTMKTPCTNSSGYKGVRWHKKARKWAARIVIKQKEIHLGVFEKIEDAIKARKEAEEKYFKPIIEEYENKIRKDFVNEVNRNCKKN